LLGENGLWDSVIVITKCPFLGAMDLLADEKIEN